LPKIEVTYILFIKQSPKSGRVRELLKTASIWDNECRWEDFIPATDFGNDFQ